MTKLDIGLTYKRFNWHILYMLEISQDPVLFIVCL